MRAIVYSSTNCTFCKQLKEYLAEQQIPYEERNIDQSEAFRAELDRMGMTSVPVTLIGEKQILGFNPSRIKKALAALEQ